MSFTVFLGNLPVWVTADDVKSWLASENLVADAVKVIRNPETQESKGFAFIESPNQEEMNSIIRRFDRAPLEDRLLRANPAQPPKAGGGKTPPVKSYAPPDRPKRSAPVASPTAQSGTTASGTTSSGIAAANGVPVVSQAARKSANPRRTNHSPARQSAFAEELAKAL